MTVLADQVYTSLGQYKELIKFRMAAAIYIYIRAHSCTGQSLFIHSSFSFFLSRCR